MSGCMLRDGLLICLQVRQLFVREGHFEVLSVLRILLEKEKLFDGPFAIGTQ